MLDLANELSAPARRGSVPGQWGKQCGKWQVARQAVRQVKLAGRQARGSRRPPQLAALNMKRNFQIN